MTEAHDIKKDPIQIIEEIKNQLEEIIHKKKEEIEKELDGRINQVQKEAKEKIDQIVKELEEKKGALINYRTTFATFEENKANIESLKKEHLDKAIQFLRGIKILAEQSLEELKQMSDLDQKIDELTHTAKEKIAAIKKDLEEKSGIVTEGLEIKDDEEIELEQDRAKLDKIKKLLVIKKTSKT